VPSTKNPSTRPAASIATATERTRSVIEDLQTKLAEVSQHGGGARTSSEQMSDRREKSEIAETEAELERQLEAYFACGGGNPGPAANNRTLDDLRKRVVDGVVKRILEDWSNAGPAASNPLKNEVLERLIERVFHQFQSGSAEAADSPPA
jgi:hypothetical protein